MRANEPIAKVLLVVGATLATLWTSAASATPRHVATTGSDAGNDCANQASPCQTIRRGISVMKGGDELVIGDGTYTDAITGLPNGTAAAYTTVRAANDWGVVIDGSGFPDMFKSGISVVSKSYVHVRGIHVKMDQAKANNEPIQVVTSDHIKIQRCSGSYGPVTGNAATFSIGPRASYVLVEESYAFGGSRYQFLVYQSDHVVVRRSVARSDHWDDVLQCAGFTNYDSAATAWQNNIVLDSDNANCKGKLYGGFFNENKASELPDTSESLHGNIVLNVKAFYAGNLDWVMSGTRTIEDMVIWGSSGGYYADQGSGLPANLTVKRMTVGGISGTYNGPNAGAAYGTGVSVYGSLTNSVTSSLFSGCNSLGVADYTTSDYNAFSGNGANYGGKKKAVAGMHDLSTENGNAVDTKTSHRYLPRIEAGSPLKSAGEGGGQIGAEVVYKIGATGALYDEPGWNAPQTEALWPFPNEDVIAKDMASYAGPGAVGARGFATGKSLDGSPQTLTKYVWEYLGNPIPPEVYAGTLGPGPGGPGGPGAPGTPGGPGDPDGGVDGAGAAGEDDSGCGCHVGSPLGSAGIPVVAFFVLALALRRRRAS
jgi:hypothetical protein